MSLSKIKLFYTILCSLTLIVFFTTCKKYDEDGKRSWHKPERRVEGTWYLKEFLVDGADSVYTWYEKKTSDPLDTIKWQLFDARFKFVYDSEKELDAYLPNVVVHSGLLKFYYFHFSGKWNLKNSQKQLDFDSQYSFYKQGVVFTSFSIFGDVTGVWEIKKLTDKEMILEADRNDNKHLRLKFQK